jgi:hypothetical protein
MEAHGFCHFNLLNSNCKFDFACGETVCSRWRKFQVAVVLRAQAPAIPRGCVAGTWTGRSVRGLLAQSVEAIQIAGVIAPADKERDRRDERRKRNELQRAEQPDPIGDDTRQDRSGRQAEQVVRQRQRGERGRVN